MTVLWFTFFFSTERIIAAIVETKVTVLVLQATHKARRSRQSVPWQEYRRRGAGLDPQPAICKPIGVPRVCGSPLIHVVCESIKTHVSERSRCFASLLGGRFKQRTNPQAVFNRRPNFLEDDWLLSLRHRNITDSGSNLLAMCASKICQKVRTRTIKKSHDIIKIVLSVKARSETSWVKVNK